MQLVCGFQSVAAAAVAICLLALANHATEAVESDAVRKQDLGAGFGNFKLFDFDYYKVRFGKRYASLPESLARKAYFMASALRAYVSGINFKWRIKSYFLAVNHLSDSSPQEKEMRRNKVMAESDAELEGNESPAQELSLEDELPEFLPAEGENVVEELRKLAEANPDKPGYRELLEAGGAAKRRRKRAVSPQETRDFSLDQLMKPGVREPVREPAEVAAKITDDVQSNNPNYEQFELTTQGLSDNNEEIHSWYISDPRHIGVQFMSSLGNLWRGVFSGNSDSKADEVKLPDVMYFDLRDSNCFAAPRYQGLCGCCYAFATIAYMEWLYCTKKGKLVPFSEQYIVDCGKGRYNDKLSGCEGAIPYAAFKFVQNFGLERRKTYPYLFRQGQCPYSEDQDVKETGYIRMELDDYVAVPVSLWDKYIEHGPLYVGIAAPLDYSEYAGGVHDGHNCPIKGNHAQLLVGHGREDGKDFWLLRNSYGPHWGVGGYFKLSKDAPKRCIEFQRGYALGTKDAINYTVSPRNTIMNRKLERSWKISEET